MRRSVALLALALAAASVARADGKALYEKYCAQCHGEKGDGKGIAAHRVKPAPRDFTPGKYKFRTTPSGRLPTDADLVRVIRQGLPYTTMPAWPTLTDQEVDEIIQYIKAFSPAFTDAEKRGDPIEIPSPPPSTPESVEKGRAVYESQGCAACHGSLGRGNGPSAPGMKDDWGFPIRPADLSMRWTFRGGPTRQDIFRTFSTGLNGTPMPSYADSLQVEDRWHLVNYIMSMDEADTPGYGELLRVRYVEDEIDLSKGAELFAAAPAARFPLVGQIMEPGRNFYPSATSLRVQAIHNGRDIALLVRWHDMRAEKAGQNAPDMTVPDWNEDNPPAAGAGAEGGDDVWGDAAAPAGGDDVWGDAAAPAGGDDVWGDAAAPAGGDDVWGDAAAPAGGDDVWGDAASATAGVDSEFSDAVALQLPSALPSGIRKPYFIFGDEQNPVDLWFLDLARGDRVQQYVGRGSASLARNPADDFEVSSAYDEGEWTVLYKRAMRSKSSVSFQEEQYVPIAYSVWDGFNRERGGKRALSSWMYLYVEPRQKVSAVAPMARAALGTLGLELLAIFLIRRRFAGKRSGSEGQATQQTVPHGGFAR